MVTMGPLKGDGCHGNSLLGNPCHQSPWQSILAKIDNGSEAESLAVCYLFGPVTSQIN